MPDIPRRPDTPPQPQPKPPQPDPATHGDWHSRNDATMTRRPEKAPETRQRGPDQQPGPRQAGPADAGQQRGGRPDVTQQRDVRPDAARPDAARKPGDGAVQGRLSTDHREWRAELHTEQRTKDVNLYRDPVNKAVDLKGMRADFTQDVKQLAADRKASGSPGGVLVDVRLKNVAVGKGSDAVAIQKSLTDVGRKDGVLVRVNVEGRNGALYTPDGKQLTTGTPRTPRTPVLPDGPTPPTTPRPGPDGTHRSGPVHPRQPGVPQQPQQPQQPVRPQPPRVPVQPHIHQPPPDIHRH